LAIEYLDVQGLVQTGRFRHAVRVKGNDTAYLSGQVPLDEDGNCIGVGDFDTQVHQVYRNLSLILSSLAVGWEAVAMMHMYIVNYTPERYARLREIRGEYLGAILPAATVLGVTALALPEFEVEVELVVDLD
jgi:enamine deaminase RidA (YjgF/YER057c/UK114 family)